MIETQEQINQGTNSRFCPVCKIKLAPEDKFYNSNNCKMEYRRRKLRIDKVFEQNLFPDTDRLALKPILLSANLSITEVEYAIWLIHLIGLDAGVDIVCGLSLAEPGKIVTPQLAETLTIQLPVRTELDRISLNLKDGYILKSSSQATVGEVVFGWRKYKGISGADLARSIGQDDNYLSNLEGGYIKRPSLSVMNAISENLETSSIALVTGHAPSLIDRVLRMSS